MPPEPRPFLSAPPLFFAHRGGAALRPENTLAAFAHAVELGVRCLESDVHATADGVLVCHHDETVDRTTDGTGRVRDLTLSELRKLDAGYRFSPDGQSFPCRGKGLVVPTLEEVVALHDETRLNIEIKQRIPDITERVFRFIHDRNLCDRFLIAAEDGRIGTRFRRISAGRVATSASRREVELFWAASRVRLAAALPVAYDALQVPETTGRLRVVDERLIRAAHRRGLHVHVWTVDDVATMRRLLALGVDGIMTDRPDRVTALAA